MKIATTRTNRLVLASLGCLLVLLIVVGLGCRKEEGAAPPSTTEPNAAAQSQIPSPTAAPAQTSAPAPNEPSPVAVTVNGEPITEAQVDERITYIMRTSPQMANLPPAFMTTIKAQMRPRVMDSLISRSLLLGAAKAAGVQVTDSDVVAAIEERGAAQNPPVSLEQLKQMVEARGGSFEQVKEDFKDGLTLEKFMEEKLAGKTDVNDAEAKAYYDSHPDEFKEPEQVKASHILIGFDRPADPNADPNEVKAAAKAKAEAILKEIKDGGDFAELAKANSTDPGSASKGGDLGFFARGQMVAPFEEAAFGLEPNAVSDLVETQYGYHIIKKTGHKDARVIPFEEAKADIIAELKAKKQATFIQEYLQELKSKATIVYPPGSEPAAAAPAPMSVAPAPATSAPQTAQPAVPEGSVNPAEPNTN